MSEYAIIFQVLAALVALFFIFLTYMNTKTWRWLHVTMTFFVFGAAVAFCFYAAMALKTRAAWIKLHADLEKQVANTEEQLQLVTHGEPKDIENKQASIASLREKLGRTIIDRGRIWRGCLPQTFDQQTGVAGLLTSPAPDPNLPPPPVKKNNIAVKTILFVFREAALPDGVRVPAAYIGEFEVTAATDTAVTMSPRVPLTREQIAAGGGPPVTWVLYETCPVDGHNWFAGLDAQSLGTLIPQQLTGIPNNDYQKLIQSYTRDGQQAEANDPPENVWIEVKFLKEYKVPVDAAAAATSVDSNPFNDQGEATLERLRRANPGQPAESVTFGPALTQVNTAVLDQATAEKLVADGICQKVRPIFRRRLTDYELRFHTIHLRMHDINDRGRRITLDNLALAASTNQANAQSMLVEELKTKLTDDLTKAKFEQAKVGKYIASLNTQLAAVQARLSELYKSNKAISRQLAKQNEDLTKEIERRSREATAKSP